MPSSSFQFNKDDGLEIRSWNGGFGVYDRATKKFVSSKQSSLYWLTHKLEGYRMEYRPLLVRWLFGLGTQESKRLGITEGEYNVTMSDA